MQTQLKELHAQFCSLTGQDLKYPQCERVLFDFHNNGFTVEDMACVLRFMFWSNSKREPKYRDRILFHRVLGDLEVFNSRLGEAKVWARNHRQKPSSKEIALAEFRGVRSEHPSAAARSVKDILKDVAKEI